MNFKDAKRPETHKANPEDWIDLTIYKHPQVIGMFNKLKRAQAPASARGRILIDLYEDKDPVILYMTVWNADPKTGLLSVSFSITKDLAKEQGIRLSGRDK